MIPTQPNQNSQAADLLTAIGAILGVSYPVLALSTGVRAVYQAVQRPDLPWLPVALSGLAALCYLIAALAFFMRRRWAWRLGLASLAVETGLTLVVGALSYIIPEVIGRTVWRHFGADYGYFPLFQPLLGLAWLVWPETLRRFGFVADSPRNMGGALLAAGRAFWRG